jgi:hypothetical protein
MRNESASRLAPHEFPIVLDDQLRLATVGGRAVQLTPRQGLDFAEELIRKSTRRAIVEESLDVGNRGASKRTRPTTRRTSR